MFSVLKLKEGDTNQGIKVASRAEKSKETESHKAFKKNTALPII